MGSYPEKDLDLLRIDAPEPPAPHPIGPSCDVQVSQMAYAIGNPFGLDRTLTTGVVSAARSRTSSRRTRRSTPGNSGGPLLDSAGRLIGVNTAIYSHSGAYSGIGFAIPVDEVNRVVPRLIRHGKATRPRLGFGHRGLGGR